MSHRTHQRKALFAGIVGASALLIGVPAGAQQQNVTSLGIEEMVVTAQKREENLQAVPISISSLSATDIERRGVQNPRDLLATMPNVGGFEPPGGKGSMSIAMRGVSGGSPSNLSVDTSTAVYIDGVIIGKMVGAATDVAELERVEVLRGPQGTLYGRNATGGAVNFITRKPTGEFGGKVTGTVGNEGLWGLRATLDTPTLGTEGEGLGTLKASLGAQTRERDGFQTNATSVQKDFDSLDREAYRLALRWEPTDNFMVDYAHDRSKLDESNPMLSVVGVTPSGLTANPNGTFSAINRIDRLKSFVQQGQNALGPTPNALTAAAASDPTFVRWLGNAQTLLTRYEQALAYNGIGKRPGRSASDARTNTDNDAKGHSLTLTWSFEDLGALGDVEFKSISGQRKVEVRNIGDLDGINNLGAVNDTALAAMYGMYAAQSLPAYAAVMRASLNDLWTNVYPQLGGGGYVQDAAFDYKQFSQELQMVGSTERLQYAVGLYYFDDDGKFDNIRNAAAPVGGLQSTAYSNETKAKALYSQFTYTPDILDDRLAVTVGYRYTGEKKGITYRYRQDNGVFTPYGTVNPAYSSTLLPSANYGEKHSKTFSNSSGSLTLAYQFSDDTNAYLRLASGYRSGGYNGEVYVPNVPVAPFKEETIKQWEVGVKSDVVPGTLRVNAALFMFNMQDMQVSQIQATPDGRLTSFITNAGEADRWGSEIEVQWSPTDSLLVSASWAHMSGDFEKYPELCGSGIYGKGASQEKCLATKNVAERPQSPDNQITLVTDWVFASTDWADFMAHVEVFWQEKTYAAALWTGSYEIGSRTGNIAPVIYDQVVLKDRVLVNLRLGMENVEFSNGSSLRASLWARNVFDREYNSYGMNFGALGPVLAQYGEPRTYGLDVTWEF